MQRRTVLNVIIGIRLTAIVVNLLGIRSTSHFGILCQLHICLLGSAVSHGCCCFVAFLSLPLLSALSTTKLNSAKNAGDLISLGNAFCIVKAPFLLNVTGIRESKTSHSFVLRNAYIVDKSKVNIIFTFFAVQAFERCKPFFSLT